MPSGNQKSRQLNIEEAQAKDDVFQTIAKRDVDVYSYENSGYPEDEEIYEKANEVSWREVKEHCAFESFKDINKSLKTSIGSYKKVFQRKDLADKLSRFTAANEIYYPSEGQFEVLSKKKIFGAFQLLNKTKLTIEEEFCLNRRDLDLAVINEKEFVETIYSRDYFIYDADKELLFAIDWDDFFFLICSSHKNVEIIVNTLSIEGFYCDDTTEAAWEFTREEIEAGLKKEKQEMEIKKIRKKP